MIIATIKQGNKRIGVYGIEHYTCLADAEHTLIQYLQLEYLDYAYKLDYADRITTQKNYIQSRNFKVIG